MTVHDNTRKEYQDDFEIVNEFICSLSDREVKWCCFYIEITEVFDRKVDDYSREELKKFLIESKETKKAIQNLSLKKKSWLIPNEMFEWIKENVRANNFVLECIRTRFENDISPYQLIQMRQVSDYFDLPFKKDEDYRNVIHPLCLLEYKIELMHKLQELFNSIILNEKYEKWLGDDENKIDWVIDYLDKRRYLINSANYRLSTKADKKYLILASLDMLSVNYRFNEQFLEPLNEELSLKKQAIIDKLKKAWNQKNFRDKGKVKNKYHLPLTKEAKRRLTKLSELHNLTESTMLQALIDEKYERECLDERGREIY